MTIMYELGYDYGEHFANYKFEGWFDQSEGGTRYSDSTVIDATFDGKTLYAHWTAIPAKNAWQYFSFSNSTDDFFNAGEAQDYDAGQYFDHFETVLTSYYGSGSAGYYMDELRWQETSGWGGSCYGFAALEGIVNHQMLPVSAVEAGKNSLPDVDRPCEDYAVRNLLNYYYLTQFIPALRSEQYRINAADGRQALLEMADEVVGGTPYMFSYFFSRGGHAIILEGGKTLSDGSYELTGQDNRFHGYTTCTADGATWVDTGEPLTVKLLIPKDGSSCVVTLSKDIVFTRGGEFYQLRSDLNEVVTSFEPVKDFSHFAAADPTGQAVTAQLQAAPEDPSPVLYYEPDDAAAADLVLKDRQGKTIFDAKRPDSLDSGKVSDVWFTIQGTAEATKTTQNGITYLESRNAPAGLMVALDEEAEYTVSDLQSGKVSMVSPEGYASVNAEEADSVILDMPNNSVIVQGNKGTFSISIDCGNDTVATISGDQTAKSMAVTTSNDLILLDAPEGRYSVTFSGGKSDLPVKSIQSTGSEMGIPTPTTFIQAPVRVVSTEGDSASISLLAVCDDGFTGQAICALYDSRNQMMSSETRALKAGSNSLTFDASSMDAVNAKIFVLDSQSRPVCEELAFQRGSGM